MLVRYFEFGCPLSRRKQLKAFDLPFSQSVHVCMKLSDLFWSRRNDPILEGAVKIYLSACRSGGKTERTLQAYR